MFVLTLFNLQGTVFAFCSRSQLAHSITLRSICQALFSSFFKFLQRSEFFAPPSRTALIYYQMLHHLSSIILQIFEVIFIICTQENGGSPARPPSGCFYIIPHRRSGRSRRRFCDRPRRRTLRYLHPGTQRSCGQADSSAAPLPLWSWV